QIVSPRMSITERKQHTENLVYLFAAANSVLYDKIDKLIGLFKQTHPDFVSRYKSARNLINTSPRKKSEA
ncbi:MAG: hypothetical protein LBQ64_06060, partial [Bacteroidales bacterium]|nr:hypothetical protein [Bacteroidales bacterium]